MTKEQKDKLIKLLVNDRNDYASACNRRIVKEEGRIDGADYMMERLLDILRTEGEDKE